MKDNEDSSFAIQAPEPFSGNGKAPIADSHALAQKCKVVELARNMASERSSAQHPVANLELRAFNHGINGRDFDEALKAAMAEGLLIWSPDCGPKQRGVFKLTGM